MEGAVLMLNPYAESLGTRDPLQALAETPQQWKQLLASLTPAAIDARPAPAKWSLRETLAHLADCEIAFSFRLRQARSGQPLIQPFDQDAWATAYTEYSAEQALNTYLALRDWNIALIRSLSEAEKQLPAAHPERGAMTLWTIVETMAGHDLHHLKIANDMQQKQANQ
jgi:uncharacterized damage-inducible protein DinB